MARLACNGTTALTIDSAGHVAVGPSLPGAKLHVQNGSVLVGGDVELSGAVRLDIVATSDKVLDAVRDSTRLYAPGARAQPVMYVTGDGCVGVLNSAPAYSLDVAGSLGVSGLAQLPGAQFASGAVGITVPTSVYSQTASVTL